VIQDVGIRKLKLAANSAEAEIARTEHQAGYTRGHQCSCAHDAGLQGRVHCGAFQPVIAGRGGPFAQCQNFSVRGRIVACYRRISASSNYAAVEDNQGADRDFPPAFGVLRQFQRLPKKILVRQVLDRHAFNNVLQPRRGEDALQAKTG